MVGHGTIIVAGKVFYLEIYRVFLYKGRICFSNNFFSTAPFQLIEVSFERAEFAILSTL